MRATVLTLSLLLTGAAYAAEGDTRLVEAVKAGEHAAAVALIEGRADVNAAEPDGTTALHWAVRNNDVALVERLLRAGADPAATNRYGVSTMMLACENGSAPVVARLLEAGVSANTVGTLGETALHLCARTGKPEAVTALLDAGATVDAVERWRGQTPLMWAAAEGHAAAMRLLIAAGADVDARSAIVEWERQRTAEPRDKWLPPGGFTPLLFAAREGQVESARVLLDAGADIDTVDPDSHTALIIALINGHLDVAGLLIDRGIDVNLADKVGRTALYAAVDLHTVPSSNRPVPRESDDELTSLEIIDRLIARGADVNTALRQQIPYRTKLDRGGDGVLGRDTTPLLRAAKAADVPVIRRLLASGADPLATNANRINAIMIAANVSAREEDMTGRNKTEREIIEAITLLQAAGTPLTGADTQGRTALHGAALWGLTDVVRYVHQAGADINALDKRGFTPLDHALGRAGGFGFGGTSGVVREETAKVIRELGGVEGTPTGTAAPERRPNGAQDPDNDRN